jgi:catechol 2,3-dioxygenase-like lactoylglutathione lyase family enzyme
LILRLSHLGLCVADLERSLRFYCDGLGFREVGGLDAAGEPSATLLELPGVEVRARFLERDGARLELLHYPRPGATGDARPRPMNAVGFTHLSFRVDDLDAAMARLEALGGRALAHTRIENPRFGARAAFLADPDGARLELVEAPGDPAAVPGAPRR